MNQIKYVVLGMVVLLGVYIGSVVMMHMNNAPLLDEKVNAAWAQVQNQYQRRADLIPNLVQSVKGYASHEQEVLTQVTQARSNVANFSITPEVLNNPQALQKFEQLQGELSSALSRLLMVSERYPDLKANQNFIALQSQLEGTENRIAVARKDYIDAVAVYNIELKTIPGKWVAGLLYPELNIKASFSAAPSAQEAPKVDFGKN